MQVAAQDTAVVRLAQVEDATIPPSSGRDTPEQIIVRAKRLLVKERNSPSAVTELGARQIEAAGISGSVATLLRQAPSVYVYQQGIGNNEPVLSIRGLRGLEVAQTLDGVPMQDLLNGGAGAYLQSNIGGRFNLDQISEVSIYPGVAYPDKSTFGTIGGTVAYQSKRPDTDTYVDVFGSVGSFQTYNEGITLNSGRLEGPFGSGDNAPKLLLQYSNLQTAGFIDSTPARYNNFELAFDKPYDDGLSKFQATVLYNTGNGLIQSEPTPEPYLRQNGLFSNYPPSALFQRQTNDYLSIILKNDKYVSDTVQVGLTAFYLAANSEQDSYGSPALYDPATADQYVVGGAAPFVQTQAGFGYFDDFYGADGGTQGFDGNTTAGGGGEFYKKGVYTYDPSKFANTPGCPASIVTAFGGAANSPCGLTDSTTTVHNDSYGIQPRVTIIPPEFYGIANTIKLGGLIAKETQPYQHIYLGVGPHVPTDPSNQVGDTTVGSDGGDYRAIYQLYLQDKVDLLEGTLHLTPGLTIEGTASGAKTSNFLYAADPALPGVVGYEPFKQSKWDREYLPFFNVSYDFDRIVPAARGAQIYGSIGNSALFAPVTDFTPNSSAGVPYASIVHLYEGGAKYNTQHLALSIDYFYQKVDRDFGYFTGQVPIAGQNVYTNDGQREFKGFEASLVYQVTPQIQLFGNVSHTLAKYLDTYLASTTILEDQFGLAQKGQPNSGIPDWLSTFGIDYHRRSTFRENDSFSARLTGEYTGQQYTTFDLTGLEANVPTPSGIPTNVYVGGVPQYPAGYIPYLFKVGATTTNPNNRLAAFALFNLDLAYVLPTPALPMVKRVKFDFNVQNLFDNHYFQYVFNQIAPSNCGTFASGPFKGLPESNYSCGGAYNDGLPGEPFAVTFTMTARF